MRKPFACLAALLALALAAQAQSGGPSESSVLQKARDKLNRGASSGVKTAPDLPPWFFVEAPEDDDSEGAYTPILVSFTPGLSIPFGYWSTSIGLGAVGSLTRDVYGFAGAGVFTLSRQVYGFQGSGVFGTARAVDGVQTAGIFAIADRDLNGAQISGIFNVAGGDAEGVQLAGLFNIAGGRLDGIQLAGLFNVAQEANSPLQAAGVFNIVDGDFRGIQVSGLFNVAGDLTGVQASPIVNVADDVDGIQLGLVNVADRLRGVQIGLVNIASNGVSGVGANYALLNDRVDAYWQNGSTFLYTLVSVGAPASDWISSAGNLAKARDATLSAGMGTRLDFGWPYLDADLSATWNFGPTFERLGAGDEAGAAAALPRVPFPTGRLLLGARILGPVQLQVGLRFDLELAGSPGLPAAFKVGEATSHRLFDLSFTAYRQWFVGLKI